MNILFLRGFNNYFNRTIKKYSAIADYKENSSSYINLSNINFNPNDGIATELIIGNENQIENGSPLEWEFNGTPDYCICYEYNNDLESANMNINKIGYIPNWDVEQNNNTFIYSQTYDLNLPDNSTNIRVGVSSISVFVGSSLVSVENETSEIIIEGNGNKKIKYTFTTNTALPNENTTTVQTASTIYYSLAGMDIVSRWFVLESERTRSGQYRLALKRDVIAEHFNKIMEAPCFVEKGYINDKTNSLLFNGEGMTYNQIKKHEYPLKDGTGCGWLVGYVPKNQPNDTTVQNIPTISTTILMEAAPSTYLTPEELPFPVSATGSTYSYSYNENNIYTVMSGFKAVYDGYSYNYWGGTKESCVIKYSSDGAVIVNRTGGVGLVDYNNNYKNKGASQLWPFIYEGDERLSISGISSITIGDDNGSLCTLNRIENASPYNVVENSISYTTIDRSPIINSSNLTQIKSNYNSLNTILKSLWSTKYNTASIGTAADISIYDGQAVKIGNNYYFINFELDSYDILRCYSSSNNNTKYDISTTSTYNSLDSRYSTLEDNTFSLAMKNLITSSLITNNYYSITDTLSYNEHRGNNLDFDGIFIIVPLYKVYLSQITTQTISIDNRVYTSRNTTFDNSADLFAIPYGEFKFKTSSASSTYTTTKTSALAMARAIAEMFSSSCYDLQLVPYCPSSIFRNKVRFIQRVDPISGIPTGPKVQLPVILTDFNTKTYQVFTDENDNPVGFVLWPSESKGTFNIYLRLYPNLNNIEESTDSALMYKLSNETQLCRIASPNYNGQFEFSLAKNSGVTYFNVDYTYKPYAPYIHVNPNFKNLYGRDWDDARGLICSGDFSINHITSYWQDYMNNNKNFQQIFDRQIQNMDVNNSIAIEKQEFQGTVGTITSAITGTLAGGASGASMGAMAGPYGAIAGGIIGAIGGGVGSGMASAYGAQKDMEWLQRQQQEARSYSIDMYGYQLKNIQAMPYSIKGTESLTNNNKIWPIVEIYEPTGIELEALTSKIQYNGMTIMKVGKLSDYNITSDFDKAFVKGKLIRLDELDDDFHIADAIYQEINKGIYIPQ